MAAWPLQTELYSIEVVKYDTTVGKTFGNR